MTAATSSGSPRRLSSMSGRSSSRKLLIAASTLVPSSFERFSIIASVMGVAMEAGDTAFTRTPSSP
jgi:hypothetical protein